MPNNHVHRAASFFIGTIGSHCLSTRASRDGSGFSRCPALDRIASYEIPKLDKGGAATPIIHNQLNPSAEAIALEEYISHDPTTGEIAAETWVASLRVSKLLLGQVDLSVGRAYLGDLEASTRPVKLVE